MKHTFAVTQAIEPLNGGLFVSPGFGTHPVRVIDSYELILATRGCLDLFEGELEFHLVPGQTLILVPGARHGGLKPYTPDANFYWAHFRLHGPRTGDGIVGVPKVATVRDPERLTELFCRFVSDQESGIGDRRGAAQLLALMLCIVASGPGSGARERRARAETRSSLVEAVKRYIDAQYTRSISTSGVARALGYNPDYLERVFRGHEDMSIVDAIHQKRIGVARAALHLDVRRNISEIAFECGYTDPGYFHRVFKRHTGMTPREFRSLYARTHINTH